MSFKQLQKELEEITKLSDKLLSAADKLTSDKYRNPQSQSKHHDQKLVKRFKQVEELAHIVPYCLKKDSQNYKVTDEDGIVREYRVKHIPSKHRGLVSFVLYSEDTENPRVHLVFRGTHSLASASRNLDTFGIKPGGKSFDNERERILKHTKEIIAFKQSTCKHPIELSVAGHSLGGADAQNCATAILSDIAKSKESSDNPLNKLGALNIMLANAAGVSSVAANKCKNSLETIHNRNTKLKVNMFACMVDGDPIQQGGYTNILADSPNEQHNTYLLKADIGEYRKFARLALILRGKISIIEGMRGGYRAHTVILFDEEKNTMKRKKANVTMRIYHNQTPGEDLIINQQLKNKLYSKIGKIFNPVRFIKSIVATIQAATGNTKRNKVNHKKDRN